MKITQTTIQKTFYVQIKDKTYYVDFVNSDDHNLSLLNRNNWEIYDESHEELDLYTYDNTNKKRAREIKKNWQLAKKLINFCIKHFNDYEPLK
ncbi:MAG: hypothetical protein Q7S74_04280 [Nanoarchaeota archaeon]|nr:hypothetical protein [Nanoarchaeota archaeon]